MLRQLILICAIGGLPLVSAAATQSAAMPGGTTFECTQASSVSIGDQTQGPVWVVQNSAPTATQGPVWVVQQERPVKPLS